jgi:outer membrane protein assembly factor BamB
LKITCGRICGILIILLILIPITITFWPKGPHYDGVEKNQPFVLWKHNNSLEDSFAYSLAIGDVDGDDTSEVIVTEDGYGFAEESPARITIRDGITGLVERFFHMNSTSPSRVALGDIDNDELSEIVFMMNRKGVFALNGDTGKNLWNQTQAKGVTSPFISPIIADVIGDEKLEVVAPFEDGVIFLLNGENGTILWMKDFSSYIYPAASLGDIDGDNNAEIIVSCDNDKTYALNAEDGSELWNYTWEYEFEWIWIWPAILADVDGDMVVEIVISTSEGLSVINGLDGTLEWSFQIPQQDLFDSFTPAIGDLNGDGQLEIICGEFGSYIYVLNGRSGTPLWVYEFGETPNIQSVSVGDFDSDDRQEVLLATAGSVITALNGEDGSTEWTCIMAYQGINGQYTPSVGDINNNGALDIVVPCYGLLSVYAIEPIESGTFLYWQSMGGTNDFSQTFSLEDVDLDFDGLPDQQEMAIGTNMSNQDSDYDSIPDSWEFHYGYDPTDANIPLMEYLTFNSSSISVIVVVSASVTVIIVLRYAVQRYRTKPDHTMLKTA